MHPDFATLIARGVLRVIDGTRGPIAYIAAYAEDGAWFVENIAVAPEAQGRGLGRALLTATETEARAAGQSIIRLFTNVVMTENQALYTRLGYRETGRRPYGPVTIVDFEKALTPRG